jgi:DNA-binding NtrC family response regulator
MRSFRVLVAHHDAVRREELATLFRRADHHTTAVVTAEAAGESLADPPDLLVLDLRLPDLDLAGLRQALGSVAGADPENLETAERRHISGILRYTAGNKRQAALILGISRSTLLHKVRKYGLESR